MIIANGLQIQYKNTWRTNNGGLAMLSEGSKLVINTLNNAGFEAYAVGGCVRDAIINIQITDWDITTAATPNEVKEVFSDKKIIDTGIQHGTVTLLICNESIEITTFRMDNDYEDHRRPSKVKYSKTLEEDLERRDFTMNALAYHPEKGIVDLFGGAVDIENKVIKCVGDPNKRFEEDSLRILRAIRFVSKLGFEIEKNTKEALFEKKELLSFLSKERITKELLETLNGKNVSTALVDYKDIWKVAVDNIDKAITAEVCFDDLMPDEILRLSRLLLPLCEEKLLVVLQSLRLSRQQEKRIKQIHSYQNVEFNADSKQLKHLMSKVSFELFDDLVELFADNKEMIKKMKAEVVNENQCFQTSMLDVSGIDLQNLGLVPSEVGKTLELMVSEVIEENLVNEKEVLLSYARGIIEKKGSN